MRTNLAIAAVVYPMVQAVLFGLCLLGLLDAGAPASLYPLAIGATFLVSAPIALAIAPRLRLRMCRHQRVLRLVRS